MGINNFFQALVPKNNKFYADFNGATDLIVLASELFLQMTKTNDEIERKKLAEQIKMHEKACDEVTHNVFKELNQTFITPFDREDIYNLASSLDDVMDYIYASSQRVVLLLPGKFNDNFIKMTEMIVLAATELKTGVTLLNNIKSPSRIKECCERISVIESTADHTFRLTLTALFKEEKDAIELIKQKEILEYIEETIDRAEDVTDIIKSILVKNS